MSDVILSDGDLMVKDGRAAFKTLLQKTAQKRLSTGHEQISSPVRPYTFGAIDTAAEQVVADAPEQKASGSAAPLEPSENDITFALPARRNYRWILFDFCHPAEQTRYVDRFSCQKGV